MTRLQVAVIGAGVMLTCLGATQPLDIQTGLWDMTTTGETTGMPPIPPDALAKMTPQQRTQAEAQMKESIAQANKPHTDKACITQKTLARGLNFGEPPGGSCKKTVVNSTSSLMEVRMECTGSDKMTGNFRFEAVSRQKVHGVIDMVVGGGTSSMTAKYTTDGQWVATNCGNVKPQE